jgi:hypothetical protein
LLLIFSRIKFLFVRIILKYSNNNNNNNNNNHIIIIIINNRIILIGKFCCDIIILSLQTGVFRIGVFGKLTIRHGLQTPLFLLIPSKIVFLTAEDNFKN